MNIKTPTEVVNPISRKKDKPNFAWKKQYSYCWTTEGIINIWSNGTYYFC